MNAIYMQDILVLGQMIKSMHFHRINNKSIKLDKVFLYKTIDSLGVLDGIPHAEEHTEVQLRQCSMTFPHIKREHQFKRSKGTCSLENVHLSRIKCPLSEHCLGIPR